MDSNPGFQKRAGKNIKKIREEKKLTQEQVAKKAGVNTNYFAVIERGGVLTNSQYLANIAKALGVDISEIIGTK